MAGMKSLLVIALVMSMVIVPSTASFFGKVKCGGLCLLTCAGNPFCLIPCLIKCKKAYPLDVEGGTDDHSLCTTGCAISNCLVSTPASQFSNTQGLTEEEVMKSCVQDCDYSCKARRNNKLD